MNNMGIAVLFYRSPDGRNQRYCVGFCTPRGVEWGDCAFFGDAEAASVAINDSNALVLVYQDVTKPELYYCPGVVDPACKVVTWGHRHRLDTGVQPSVSLNNSGLIIEMHKSERTDRLWYSVGCMNRETLSVQWSSSRRHDTGIRPSVVLTDYHYVVEVHQSDTRPNVWYHVGHIEVPPDPRLMCVETLKIDWGTSKNIGEGTFPSIAFLPTLDLEAETAGLVVVTTSSPLRTTDKPNINTAANDRPAVSPGANISGPQINSLFYRVGLLKARDRRITFDTKNGGTGEDTPIPFAEGVTPSLAMSVTGLGVEVHCSTHDLWLYCTPALLTVPYRTGLCTRCNAMVLAGFHHH